MLPENYENTIKKITILTRIIETRLRRYPHAYMDYSDRINPVAYHNYRCMLADKLETDTDFEYIVVIDENNEEAILLNREEYLANYDYYWDKFHKPRG